MTLDPEIERLCKRICELQEFLLDDAVTTTAKIRAAVMREQAEELRELMKQIGYTPTF